MTLTSIATLPPERPAEGWAAVYRFFDPGKELIYIGSSNGLARRWSHHRRTQTWWPQVAYYDLSWHANRGLAYAAEMKAIGDAEPRHNVMGTSRYVFRRTSEQLAAGRARAEAMGEFHRVRRDVIRALQEAGSSAQEAWTGSAWAGVAYLEETGMFPGWVEREKRRLKMSGR